MNELKKYLLEDLQVPKGNFDGRSTEEVAIEVMKAMVRAYQTVCDALGVATGTDPGNVGPW